MNSRNEFQFPQAIVSLDKIPASGRTLRLGMTPDQLEELARISRVNGVERFEADIVLETLKGGLRVSGRLRARVVQPCVVTLEALPQEIDEPLDRVFLSGRHENDQAGAGSVRFVDLERENLPDYFEGTELDLSDYLLEILGLAINLYPRASGAEMAKEQKGDDPALLSPFAALKDRRDASKKNA